MRCLIFLLLTLSAVSNAANYTRFDNTITKETASVGSNTTPNSKAVLDLVSTTKGFLPPRQTTTQRDAITSPPAGLELFNSTTNAPNFYDGANWYAVASTAGTATLTNKSISGTANTITNIALTTAVSGTLPPGNGGSGVGNVGTMTWGSNNITLTTGGVTSITLPTAGTAATTGGVETLANKSLSGSTNTFTNIPLGSAVTGVLAIANGGTAGTTAQGAIDNLLPSQGGNSGKYLTTNGSASSWGTVAGGGLSIVSANGAGTASTGNDVVLLSASGGAYTYNLYPASTGSGKLIRLKKTADGGNAVTIDGNSSETIDGATTIQLVKVGDYLELISDGANWKIISDQITSFTHYHTTDGWGSTNTKIRKFTTNAATVGNAFTVTNSATEGFYITINLPGMYSFTFTDVYTDVIGEISGITYNVGGADLTTNVTSVTTAKVLCMLVTANGDHPASCSWSGKLDIGDVIWAHGRAIGTESSAPSRGHFWGYRL